MVLNINLTPVQNYYLDSGLCFGGLNPIGLKRFSFFFFFFSPVGWGGRGGWEGGGGCQVGVTPYGLLPTDVRDIVFEGSQLMLADIGPFLSVYQGNLLRGIDNCSGVARFAVKDQKGPGKQFP